MTAKAEAHRSLIALLFVLASQAREQGTLSLESHIENPQDSALIKLAGVCTSPPDAVVRLVLDTWQLILSTGLCDEQSISTYLDTARCADGFPAKQTSQFDVARAFFTAYGRELAPRTCAEFARQAFPHAIKPSAVELDQHLRKLLTEMHGVAHASGDLSTRIAALFARMS